MSSSPPCEVVDTLAAAAGSQSQTSIFDMDIDLGAPILPRTSSNLFSENLYTRVIVDTRPPQIRYICQQPHCQYIAPLAPLDNKYTSNLWKHYDHVHPVKPKLPENKYTPHKNHSSLNLYFLKSAHGREQQRSHLEMR